VPSIPHTQSATRSPIQATFTAVSDLPLDSTDARFRAAEFFAGIGLVSLALDEAGIDVVWANDIEPVKARLHAANFDSAHYVIGDVRGISGSDLPQIDLATASFPCTDLSLAGWRKGLAGEQSGMFWEFARVLEEMDDRRPATVLLENVPGFATSHGGRDLYDAIRRLNTLGYSCDIMRIDARRFLPQSRPRLFVVGSTKAVGDRPLWPDELRPPHVVDFAARHADLRLHAGPIGLPDPDVKTLADFVECVPGTSEVWWGNERAQAFLDSLSPLQAGRLEDLRAAGEVTWRTAYRRTRAGVAVWEIRSDPVSGCLRTARGGSSKQAVVEAGQGSVRVRWMTAREYARLQGVEDSFRFSDLSPNQVMFGFGDAVCVPVVAWIAKAYLRPLLGAGGRKLVFN